MKENQNRKVFSVDTSFLVAVDADVTPEEMETSIDEALSNMPGVRAYSSPHLLVQPVGKFAYCCPVCGSPIRQEIQLEGAFVGEINMASGVPENSEFDGDQTVIYTCSVDPSHNIPEEFVELLTSAIEISPDATS